MEQPGPLGVYACNRWGAGAAARRAPQTTASSQPHPEAPQRGPRLPRRPPDGGSSSARAGPQLPVLRGAVGRVPAAPCSSVPPGAPCPPPTCVPWGPARCPARTPPGKDRLPQAARPLWALFHVGPDDCVLGPPRVLVVSSRRASPPPRPLQDTEPLSLKGCHEALGLQGDGVGVGWGRQTRSKSSSTSGALCPHLRPRPSSRGSERWAGGCSRWSQQTQGPERGRARGPYSRPCWRRASAVGASSCSRGAACGQAGGLAGLADSPPSPSHGAPPECASDSTFPSFSQDPVTRGEGPAGAPGPAGVWARPTDQPGGDCGASVHRDRRGQTPTGGPLSTEVRRQGGGAGPRGAGPPHACHVLCTRSLLTHV